MRLMLLEDEYVLNKTITAYLQSKGYSVEPFLRGEDAFEAISAGFDLFILDIDIPDINGIEVLERIRSLYPDTPIIMISATIDMNTIEKAYSKGCSDYLKKPFDIKELELKINAFLRHLNKRVSIADGAEYDKESMTLHYHDTITPLSLKENLLLRLLLENRGSVVSHEQIEMAVWSDTSEVPHVRQLVNRLRKKLPLDIIKSRIGQGYIIE